MAQFARPSPAAPAPVALLHVLLLVAAVLTLQQWQLAAALAFVHLLQLAPEECVNVPLLQHRTGEPDPPRGLLRMHNLALAMLKAYADRFEPMPEETYNHKLCYELHVVNIHSRPVVTQQAPPHCECARLD